MPLQNRVTPTGELIVTPHRGTFFGNRGVLHDERQRIVRRHQVRRWITCVLQFRGRQRPAMMMPRRYTELYFLDEAVAFAAGHRPCGECRYADYQAFRRLWTATRGLPSPPNADGMDVVLHAERGLIAGRRSTYQADCGALPDGVFLLRDGRPWLVRGGSALLWSPAGYTERRPLPAGPVPVLTPRSIVAVIAAGYRPVLHPSAG
jgi:hypothetical protein